MAVAGRLLLVAVLLLFSSGLRCSSPPPACPPSCTCQGAPLLNCSSSGLSSAPRHIQDSVTVLDLSHNLLSSVTLLRAHRNLRNVWLGNNSIARLSLCIERNVGSQNVPNRHGRRLRPWSRRGCVSWAPSLQLLSVEKNQLEQLPEGLEGTKSLQVLQLSFNRISALRPGDVRNLPQLKELHLQHNLITSVDPLMFQDLVGLRVLDLSFNMLTSLHPLTYPSLRNIGADVRLDGNRFDCDCSLRGLRRRMVYDDSRGLRTWRVLCDSPPTLSGKDLLQLEEDDLNCLSTENMSGLHRDVSVYSGSEILLTCSTRDPVWWTPSGRTSAGQPQVISDITDRDAGLYVCVSEDHRVVSVFNLQIRKVQGTRRNARSLPRDNQQVTRRNDPSLAEFNLAVCLSVFITFLVAFIIGVLVRPFIDVLWKRVTTKKRSTPDDSGSPVEQRQYDNEAFSSGEEPGPVPAHRERRVTFSTIDTRDENNVHYYDTVASGGPEYSNEAAVVECEVRQTAGHSGSNVVTSGGHAHMEFEPIPDPDELEERSLSSRSDSSLSEKVLREKPMIHRDTTITKSPQLEKESVQQRPDVPVSTEGTSEIPEFSSEPFSDWSPHTHNDRSKDFDLWQEKEEQFEFSDSVRSTSERSSIDEAPTSHRHERGDTSSSSSYVSDDEPTQYTVNSDHEEEGNKETTRKNNDIQRPAARSGGSSSSDSSHSDCEPVKNASVTKQKEERKETSTSGGSGMDRAERKTRVPSLSSSSSSSSDSEHETTHRPTPGKMNIAGLPFQKTPSPTLRARFPAVDLEHIPRIKRRLDIKALSLGSDSSSGSDSENETDRPRKAEAAKPSLESPGRQQTKEPSPASASSSSSDSEDEALGHTGKLVPAKVDVTYKESQTPSDPVKGWPVIDLERIPHIKRRLDVKAPSPDSDSSSSSDSEEERTGHTGRRSPTKLDTAEPPVQARWPALDFDHLPRIERRLDVKAASPASDSSSSSDSEDEAIKYIKKEEQDQIHMARPAPNVRHEPDSDSSSSSEDEVANCLQNQDLDIKSPLNNKAPSTDSDSSSSSDSEDEIANRTGKQEIAELPLSDRDAQWPALDFGHMPRIKKRLDIKAPPPASDSSPSSDSEDEVTTHTKKLEQGEIHVTRLPGEISQTATPEPETRWPTIDLELTTHIKRRLDIKAPPQDSDSSSSSDSEEERTGHTGRRSPTKLDTAEPPVQARWPALDFDHLPRIERRLDVKAASPASDSSSSSDSEDEAIKYIKKEEQDQIHMARPAPNVRHEPDSDSSSSSEDEVANCLQNQDLDIKSPLNNKAPSTDSDSSSSSDSEDEIANRTGKQEIAELPLSDRDAQWPALDFGHMPRIKKRLDIKAPPPASDSSPSSDSEDEVTTHTKKLEQGEIHVTRLPGEISQTATPEPETRWPTIDLELTTHIKRRLDIKAPPQDSDSSSSSDSEEERTGHTGRRSPTKLDTAEPPAQARWPALDFDHLPRIERRLDIKAPSPASDSSSSSDSEDEAIKYIKKEEQDQIHMARPAPNVRHEPDSDSSSSSDSEDEAADQNLVQRPPLDAKWPTLDLERVPHLKRRLDIKTPPPPPPPDSKVEKYEKKELHMSKLSLTDSETGLQAKWPAIDFENMSLKRRLDIKAPSPASDSSSSSDSEDEAIKKKEQDQIHMARPAPNVRHEPDSDSSSSSDSEDEAADQNLMQRPPLDTKWPTLDLERVPHLKRRLDIKTPPPPPPHSPPDSEDEKHEKKELHMSKLPLTNTETGVQAKWPAIDFENMSLKRRLDIKAPSQDSDSSSSSDSENEEARRTERPEKVIDLKTQWPTVNLGNITGIKRRLDIKSLSPPHELLLGDGSKSHAVTENRGEPDEFRPYFTSSSSDEEENSSKPPTKAMSDPKWPELDLSRATHVKRRVDIKARTPSLGSGSSGDSGDEEAKNTKVVGLPKSPLTNPFEHPKKKPSITLEKYTVITDSSSSTATDDNSSTTAEINPELQSRWATMNLGISRFRKRLEITSRAPPSPPSGGNDGKSHNTRDEETRDRLVESDSVWPKRSPSKASDVSARSQTEPSPSSSGEDELTRPSAGVPRIKRYLNIKAPSPDQSESSSSCSEGEGQAKRLTTGESRPELTDSESVIAYKRSIMKVPSLPSESRPTTRQREMGAPSLNFDDVVKKRINHYRSATDLDLPPQIRWTGLHLSDLSVYSSGKNLDVDTSPQTPEPDKSTGRTNEILTLSEEKREKRGLSALKVMSSERRTWDREEPLDLAPQRDTSFNHRRSEDVKQPLKQFHVPSASTDEKRAAGLLYGIRGYRRRDGGDTKPPQEAPPPVPETPPPDEAAEPTWRSPQRSGAASRNEEGSLTPQSLVHYFASSKMNASDV